MTLTITLEAVFCGTALHILQEGLPDAIPLDAGPLFRFNPASG